MNKVAPAAGHPKDRTIGILGGMGPLATGARVAILACTEVPAAFRGDEAWMERHCVDSTAALARACVTWALGE